jgi:hypothetical protein
MRGGPPDAILTQAGQTHHGNFQARKMQRALSCIKKRLNSDGSEWIMRNDWDIVGLFGILKNNK